MKAGPGAQEVLVSGNSSFKIIHGADEMAQRLECLLLLQRTGVRFPVCMAHNHL